MSRSPQEPTQIPVYGGAQTQLRRFEIPHPFLLPLNLDQPDQGGGLLEALGLDFRVEFFLESGSACSVICSVTVTN